MPKRLFWHKVSDILADYPKVSSSKMRIYAVLALISLLMVSTIPFVAGNFVSSIVVMEEKGEIDPDFVAITGTAIVFVITIWYVTTTHANRELKILALKMTRSLRDDLDDKLMRMSVGSLDKMRSGDAAAKIATDLPAVFDLLSRDFVAFFTGNVMIALILIIMLFVSVPLALVYFITIPITLYAAWRITNRSKEDLRRKKESVDVMGSAMSDIIANHSTIKANNLEAQVMRSFEEYDREFVRSTVGAETRAGLISPLVNIAVHMDYVAAVVAGALMMYNGSLDIGMFLAFMVYVRLIDKPLAASVASYYLIESETMSLKRIFSVLNAPEPEWEEPEDGFEPQGRLEFRDVCFAYENVEVLHSVSFTVEPGTVAVITGPTGSGKSTLMNLLLRFFPLKSGSVRIDGRDVNEISRKDLSRTVAAVLQDPWVFDGTIRDNIVYNRDWATQEDLDRAIRISGFDAYISGLQDGLDTPVGNDIHVMPLAARRMLAMSRAILGDPKILILDEAFSGLDPLTGSAVYDGLMRIMKGRTVLIVSHEKNLIDSADQVIRMESGRIVG